MTMTFKLDDVRPDEDDQPLQQVSAKERVQAKFVKYIKMPDPKRSYGRRVPWTQSTVWAATDKQVAKESRNNPLIDSVAFAHNEHWPLSISPDAVWLCIAQGFATFVLDNAEALRSQFVSFEGKQYLEVDVPHSNAESLNWDHILGVFSDKIAEHTGKKRDLFVSNFSTTGIDERMASEVVLMRAMSEYFTYGMRTMCGFPSITLEGTVDDWKSVRDRFRVFAEFEAKTEAGLIIPLDGNLKWWSDVLSPILDQFVATAEGKVDKTFWKSFYKEDGGSGGPFINGWINALFPFMPSRKGGWHRNRWVLAMFEHGRMMRHGPNPSDFPAGLTGVDVKWNDLGNMRDMEFHGGLIGISQAEDMTVRAECGWAVTEKNEKPEGAMD
jgi:hypothetical protein